MIVRGVRRPSAAVRQRFALRQVRQAVDLDVLSGIAVGHVIVVVAAAEDATAHLLFPLCPRSQEGPPYPGGNAMTGVLAHVDVRDDDGHEQGDGHHDHGRAEQHAYNTVQFVCDAISETIAAELVVQMPIPV